MAHVSITDGPGFEAAGGDTLLQAALRAGIGFPYECSAGGCGSCKFELQEGEIDVLWPNAPGLSPRDQRKGLKLACQCRPAGDLRIKVRLADEYIGSIRPRQRGMTLVDVQDLTHDMRQFTFSADGPAHFQAGQYCLVDIPGTQQRRAYSLSNTPNVAGLWQFIIRRLPGGKGSQAMFDTARPGDNFNIDGPYGLAGLRPTPRDILCIAGGSGFAPMLSIARAAAPALALEGKKLHFYYGGRTPEDMRVMALLAELESQTSALSCQDSISEAGHGGRWAGRSGYIHGLVEEDLGDRLKDLEIYFAGPPPMIEAVQQMLMLRHQVPFSQIHFDRFY